MVLEVVNEKGRALLYGRKMTVDELEEQIKFVEKIAGQLKEDFAKAIATIYDWEPVLQWDKVDYVYNSDTKTLSLFVPETEKEEDEENPEGGRT